MAFFFQISEEITLGEIQLSDAKAMFKAIDSNRKELRTWLPFIDDTMLVSDSEDFIDYTRRSGDLILVIRWGKEFIGLIGLKDTDWVNRKTEIGYWLIASYRKRGVITRSIQRLFPFIFNELKLNRIQIKVAVENMNSRNIPEKLGFKTEGIERDGELLASGFTDLYVYSMLKTDEAWKINSNT